MCETLSWEFGLHRLVFIPSSLIPWGLLLTEEQRSWIICPKSTLGGGGGNQIKSKANCLGHIRDKEKEGVRKQEQVQRRQSKHKAATFAAGSCPSSWRSQLCTQGLSTVTFHTAESYQEENMHPRLVFGSWLLNLFPKSLRQISIPPQMKYFSFHKTQVDASPFLCRKRSCRVITGNPGSEWKLMLLMKSAV